MYLAANFLFEVSHDVEVRCQLGQQSSESWTGMDIQEGWFTWLAVSLAVGLELRWSCQSERLHRAFLAWWSQGRQNCYMMATIPRVSIPKVPGRCFLVFFDLASEVTQSDYHCILLVNTVTSPLSYKRRRHSPHFSMRTVARSHAEWDISCLKIKSVPQWINGCNLHIDIHWSNVVNSRSTENF